MAVGVSTAVIVGLSHMPKASDVIGKKVREQKSSAETDNGRV
jgi:hypothetical protein